VVAPGSKQVVEMLSANGRLAYILGAGVRMAENACGFCIGNSQSPKTEAISLRTSNRNFLGRSGTKSANAYLVSPETAAAGAITGKFIDPRKLEELGIEYPNVEMPEGFIVNDNMIMPPVDDPGDVEISRGPNIGDPPKNVPLPELISGEVVIKVGDEITTDHIIPAGSKMKYRSNVPKYSEFLFEVVDDKFFERAKGIRDSGNDNVIVAGISYGQGSSREHAALCPMYMGVKAVITKGMERIHKANLVNFGIVPLDFVDPDDYDSIDQGDGLEIPDVRSALEGAGNTVTVKNTTKGTEFQASFDLSEKDKEKILAGGTLNLIAEQMR